MALNIHPIFVHFPIGLLTVYSFMELVPRRLTRSMPWWQGAKIFLLTLGFLSTIPVYVTGDAARRLLRNQLDSQLVGTHELFAKITMLLYFVLFAAYVVRAFGDTGRGNKLAESWGGFFIWVWRGKQRASELLLDTLLRPLLALAALGAITVTGGLGGAIVYGPNADPFVSFLYNLFF